MKFKHTYLANYPQVTTYQLGVLSLDLEDMDECIHVYGILCKSVYM